MEEAVIVEERNSNQKSPMDRYNELFPDDETKAAAFDKLALHFYDANFGTMSKADIEVLMFSEYIERILGIDNQAAFSDYSDYILSKNLGITQSRIANLKVKKQLKYPHEYNWTDSFQIVCKNNARYENGRIKIQIPDINLYYEVKNAIEESGGFVDVTLTSKLLQVRPEYYIDLLLMTSHEDSRKEILKALRKEIRKYNKDTEFMDTEPIGKQLSGLTKDVFIEVVSNTVSDVKNVATVAANVKQLLGTLMTWIHTGA